MKLSRSYNLTLIWLQSLDGFAMAVAADGRFLYISETVSIYLGLSQVNNSEHKLDVLLLRLLFFLWQYYSRRETLSWSLWYYGDPFYPARLRIFHDPRYGQKAFSSNCALISRIKPITTGINGNFFEK